MGYPMALWLCTLTMCLTALAIHFMNTVEQRVKSGNRN